MQGGALPHRPPRIVVVGAGPAGFYTTEALLGSLPDCSVEIVERLAVPHGLVRHGVAPDHQKLKQVAAVFDAILHDPRVSLRGGIDVGADVTLDELRGCCDAVVLATGSAAARRLDVRGEALPQVYASAQFVGWYNGHPEQVGLAPDLRDPSAVVIGNGNVALDVTRLLLRRYEELQATDIPEPMLQAFSRCGVRRVHVVGRGGPSATRFSFREFRQLVELPGVRVRVAQAVDWDDAVWSQGQGDADRIARWLQKEALRGPAPSEGDVPEREVLFWFHARPLAFRGDARVEGLTLSVADPIGTAPSASIDLPCGIAITCVGHVCKPLPGLSIEPRTGGLRHRDGQVLDASGGAVPGLFVAGWAKRGPAGIIGTNRADGVETARTLLSALPALQARRQGGFGSLGELLDRRSLRPLSAADWSQLDQVERARGAALGKPREKILSLGEAWAVFESRPGVAARS